MPFTLYFNQKPKLSLQEKIISKQSDSNSINPVRNFKNEKDFTKTSKDGKLNQKDSINQSNSFKKRVCKTIGSLESRKIEFVGKENLLNAKLRANKLKVKSKSSLELKNENDIEEASKKLQGTLVCSFCSGQISKRKSFGSDQFKEIFRQQHLKFLKKQKSSQNSSEYHDQGSCDQKSHGSTTENRKSIGTSPKLFNCQENTHLRENMDTLLQKFKRNPTVTKTRKYSRIIQCNNFSIDSAVFSLEINISSNIKNSIEPRSKLIQQCLNDPDFEWKFSKYKEYSQKYTQLEMKIKQNFQTLQFLTQNINLLKERISPFKSISSLKEIVEILKPTLSQKEESAFEIKMQMLDWKKKFFTNVRKIKQSLNKNIEEKYSAVFAQLHQNENTIENALKLLDSLKKGETVTFSNMDIENLYKPLDFVLMNQKSIMDQIRLSQREGELLLVKFNNMEEEWSHVFEIFNSTLENCVDKCFLVSECIQKFYGKSCNESFLTKGFQIKDSRDLKAIENEKCNICKWNQVKIKKIISENTLAKGHLQALKHLIAN